MPDEVLKGREIITSENVQEKFEEKINEEKRNSKKANVLVCGYTGSGKTSLLQIIFGKETVPDSAIGHGSSTTADYIPYENAKVKIWDSEGFSFGNAEEKFLEKTRSFIRNLQDDIDIDNHVHIVWYTIQGCMARVTEYDLDLIRKIFKNVIVIITKKDITKEKQMDDILNNPRTGLITHDIQMDRILAVDETDRESIKKLIDLTYNLLPAAYRDAFIAAQMIDLEKKITWPGLLFILPREPLPLPEE